MNQQSQDLSNDSASHKPYVPSEEEVWLRAWCATISSEGVWGTSECDKFADSCLESYKKRFKK